MPVYNYTTLDDPFATHGTLAYGINGAGQIVGFYLDDFMSGEHGFLLSGGDYTTLDTLAPGGTQAFGINAAGAIVGSFSDAIGSHGFLLGGGAYTALNGTIAAVGINGAGQIVGYSTSSHPGIRPRLPLDRGHLHHHR